MNLQKKVNQMKVSRTTAKNNARTNRNGGQSRIPLLPVGVNNKQTVPQNSQNYTYNACETIKIINVPNNTAMGDTLFNDTINPASAPRLSYLANAWQRIDWDSVSLHLVALNGSTATSGYTMGFAEDPDLEIPTAKDQIIGFLTALRGTTVRQAWVESSAGQTVNVGKLPEMYTTKSTDNRRYSIGRLVIAASGPITTGSTFQLMIRYKVKLYVPRVVFSLTPTPPTPITRIYLSDDLTADPDTIEEDTPSVKSSAPIPNKAGNYYFLNEEGTRGTVSVSVTSSAANLYQPTIVQLNGFRVKVDNATDWKTQTVPIYGNTIRESWFKWNGPGGENATALVYQTPNETVTPVFISKATPLELL
jgi:hypothetical protein